MKEVLFKVNEYKDSIENHQALSGHKITFKHVRKDIKTPDI